jgi:Thioredoxin-like domain
MSMGTSVLIAYIDENDKTPRSVFTSFATSHENDFIYGITSDLILAKADSRKPPFIILYNPLSQVNPIFQESFKATEIEAFTKKYSTPLMGTFSLETYYAYTEVPSPLYTFSHPLTSLKEGKPLAHIFVSSPSEQSTLVARLKPLAEKFKGKLNFATIDATKYGFFAKVLNLVPGGFPAFVIEDTVTGDAVPFDQNQEVTAEKIARFVEKYFRDREGVPEQTAVS